MLTASTGCCLSRQVSVAHSWPKRRMNDWLIYDEADLRQATVIRIGAVSLLRGGGGRLGRPVRRLAVVPLIYSAVEGPGCRCGAPGDSINQSACQRRP